MRLLRLSTTLLAFSVVASASALSISTGLNVIVQDTRVGSVPLGAQRIEFLRISLNAGCDEDVSVESITLSHRGLGDPADISGVSLWKDNARLTRSVKPDERDGRVTLRPRLLNVPKCSSVVLTLRADLSPEASVGGEHSFVLERPEDISSSARSVSLAVDQRSPVNRTGSVTPAVSGTIEAHMLPVSGPVTYGSRRSVAKLQLRSIGSRRQQVTSITLTNDGSAANTDLQNLYLTNARGARASNTLPSMNGDTVTFTLDPALVFEGSDTFILNLKADVRASRRRTIDFGIEEPSDIEASVCSGARMCVQAH